MNQTRLPLLCTLLLPLAVPNAAHALDAGVANFVYGEVIVRSANGSTAPLQKGKGVQSGDDILTSAGSQAQIRFSDGGMVAIQPNSQFKLASYADKNDPKNDSFLVELARGGMRAITGLIGKRNRENYKITTNTATIGIRGSSFSINYEADGSVKVNAEQDAIVVCTNSGCTGLTAGEIVQVKDKNQTPTRTTQSAPTESSVPPPQTQTVSGNKVYLLNNLQADFLGMTANGSPRSEIGYSSTNSDKQATAIIADLPMVSYGDSDASRHVFKGSNISSFNTSGDPYASDYVGWGYWASASESTSTATTALQDVHYVVGNPTLQMPSVGTFDYNMIGGTVPTATNASTGATISGQLVGASMTVNFNSSYIQSISATTRFNGTDYVTSTSGISLNGSRFSDSSGGTSFRGVFAGEGAAKAAFVYQQTGTAVGTITGAVGMSKGAENTNNNYAQ